MIVDLHTQVWSSPEQLGQDAASRLRSRKATSVARLDASTAAHEEAMGCVDVSAVLGFRADRLGALIPNEFVAQFVARDPERRIGIAGIDPMSDDASDEVERAIGLGLCGVALSPALQGFHPLHSSAVRIYERCAEQGLPVVVTMDGPVSARAEFEFARPGHWDEVARSFPGLRIVLGQLGHPWIDETLFLLGKHEHIFADLAGLPSRPWQLYNALLNAEHFGVMDRLLFGSGFPQETPARAIETLYSLNTFSQGTQLPSVPRAHIREIVERDSLALLGLDHLVTGANPGGRMTVETFPGGADRPTPSIPSPHEPRR